VFVVGEWLRNRTVSRVALVLLLVAAIAVIPAYLLGEGAEEAVENLAGVSERVIEAHEDAAVFALWLTILLGTLSTLGVVADRFGTRFRKLTSAAILCVSLLASASLAYTGYNGGMIRHPEAYDGTVSVGGGEAEDDDD